MIDCPSCESSRIRNDYKPAPFFLRMIGIRALLCDNCNLQFRAFSLRSPRQNFPHHTRRKADVFNPAREVDLNQLNVNQPVTTIETPKTVVLERRPAARISQKPVKGELVHHPPLDLRTQITRLHEQRLKDAPEQNNEVREASSPVTDMICPDCGSNNVYRRHRNKIEKAVFSISDHKAFTCRDCDASFYSKADGDGDGSRIANTFSR